MIIKLLGRDPASSNQTIPKTVNKRLKQIETPL